MMRQLFNNTIISTFAFCATGALGILIVPVIVQHWGLAAFGLIVLSRSFVPQGLLSIFDLGASEISTQAVARARVNGNWDGARRRIGMVLAGAIAMGIVAGGATIVCSGLLAGLFKVDPEQQAEFIDILRVTGLTAALLMPALVAEGIVKGFEELAKLRSYEVVTTIVYVVVTFILAQTSWSYAVVAYAYLATLVLRFTLLSWLASVLMASQGGAGRPTNVAATSQLPLGRHVLIMTQTKLIGIGQNQIVQPLVGIIFGPAAAGLFDLLVRLPRFARTVLSVLNTALLPVTSRLDETDRPEALSRLGRVALFIIPAITIPPLVGAAIMSETILSVWIGPDYTAYWIWMAIMFAVPISSQYSAFGSAMMLARPHVQLILNRMTTLQLALIAVVALITISALQERSFILAQVLSTLAILPTQIYVLGRQLHIGLRAVARFLGSQIALLIILGTAYFVLLQLYPPSNLLLAGICLVVWTAVVWLLECALLFQRGDHEELARMVDAARDIVLRRVRKH
ncbi:MAG: hypothetical protein MO846_05840 [Candidatus Devosia symbiotica]|nr:hypothetical protein [Candidatus Devosia symbiotica]